MRVFQLNAFCGIKSTGRIATDIAQLLEQQGDECLIGYGAEAPPAELARFAYRIGGPIERKIHGAIRKLFDGEGYGSVVGTLRLIRKMKAFQPDVVHLHNLHGCYLNLRILFRYLHKSGLSVLWTLHDCWPFTGHCAYFDYVGCTKWQTECGQCPQLYRYPISWGWDGSARNFRHKQKWFNGLPKVWLTPPSHWLQGLLGQSMLKAYPVRVVENGVDMEAFHPQDQRACDALRDQHGLMEKKVVLAVAADWDERKGLPFLLEAAAFLPKDHQVVALGLTTAQIAALPEGVRGLPATASLLELATWYSLADCLANPTLEENMPLVNLEALACGTPVAVFDTGGCGEVVDDSCGYVVPKGDAAALAQAISDLTQRKTQLQKACLARAARYDRVRCYQKYLAIYKELCP